jgi:hypothetical protein
MKKPIEIIEPAIKILKSSPSSLGWIDCYMVIFDRTAFPAGKYGNIVGTLIEQNYLSVI